MKYQLIILGAPNKFEQAILDLLFKQIDELGMIVTCYISLNVKNLRMNIMPITLHIVYTWVILIKEQI